MSIIARRPDQNAYIERFNRSDRTEVLNAHLFESIAELRALTDTWLRIYNSERVLFHKSADILRASRDWTISSYRAGR